MIFTDDQLAYLNAHKWAVLATGRKDGSPQVSQVGYAWDGEQLLVSVKAYTAKWKNAKRQPKVALLVHDGRRQLVIYGTAECIDADPARADLTARIFTQLMGNAPELGPAFTGMLDAQQRTVLRITPTSVSMND